MTDKKKPESLMMSYGYKPELSEGAIKPPIFKTSTFAFKTAEEGKAFFEVSSGKRELADGEELGLIYSRLNNPNLEIFENRLKLWDTAEDCAVFQSGMAAISTALLEYLRPGDTLLVSNPLYGGTEQFVKKILPQYNIEVLVFEVGQTEKEIIHLVESSGRADRLAMVYVETPANPTNDLIDIEVCRSVADYFGSEDKHVMLAVDNTYMGPIWQHPLKHGADLVLYSATKYIGGHSDLIAGACLGSSVAIKRIKKLRSNLGNMADPETAWLLMRSLETLKVRMDAQAANAETVAEFLNNHPKIEKVYYLGNFSEDAHPSQYAIRQKQCFGNGAMLSFDIAGGEPAAFRFLNALRLIKLAVSLGSTESLAEHPNTMTHANVHDDVKARFHITGKMVRLSVGIENANDLCADIDQALSVV